MLPPSSIELHLATPEERESGGAGMEIHWGVSNSPFGKIAFAHTPRGISHLGFFDPDPSEARHAIAADWPNATLIRDDDETASQFTSKLFSPGPLSLHLAGSEFQIAVWRALLDIPAGTLTSYARLAERLGKPGAARAVGNAVAKNRIAILVPCHRVIRENGGIGGFRWGTAKKHQLIEAEQAHSLQMNTCKQPHFVLS